MAKELAASLEKSTEARLRIFFSDIFTKRSAADPRKVGNAFICIAMSSKLFVRLHIIGHYGQFMIPSTADVPNC